MRRTLIALALVAALAVLGATSPAHAAGSWKRCATFTDSNSWMRYDVHTAKSQSCVGLRRVARYFANHPADQPYRGWRMVSQRSSAFGLVARIAKGRRNFSLRATDTCRADGGQYVDEYGDCVAGD